MNDQLPPAVFLMGPTATGKTDLAIALCEQFPFDIISVDSALVYRGMDIGTAKPSRSILEQYPHHLVDILDPAEAYSAAQFRGDALQAMTTITEQGRIPLLVGGTMLYFRALQQGLSELPQADAAIRLTLQARLEHEGLTALHDELSRIDPQTAQRVHPNDPQRILRALEVYQLTGEPLSCHLARQAVTSLPFRICKVVLWPEQRGHLHQRIEERFVAMLSNGFVDEVSRLRSRGDLSPDKPSMRTVGYRQVWQYLDGDLEAAAMREQGVIATRQLAKRQMTWLRNEADCRFWDFEQVDFQAVNDFITDFLHSK